MEAWFSNTTKNKKSQNNKIKLGDIVRCGYSKRIGRVTKILPETDLFEVLVDSHIIACYNYEIEHADNETKHNYLINQSENRIDEFASW